MECNGCIVLKLALSREVVVQHFRNSACELYLSLYCAHLRVYTLCEHAGRPITAPHRPLPGSPSKLLIIQACLSPMW